MTAAKQMNSKQDALNELRELINSLEGQDSFLVVVSHVDTEKNALHQRRVCWQFDLDRTQDVCDLLQDMNQSVEEELPSADLSLFNLEKEGIGA